MARAKNPGKLSGKSVGTAVTAPSDLDSGDFPDALSFINSLVASREGAEWNCRVYQIISAGRGATERMPFLYEAQLEDLPELESRLGNEYPGGGTFRVQVRENNMLRKNIRLDIAPRPGYKPPPPAWAAPVQVQPTDNPQTDRMEMFFTRLADMQERSAQQTRELISAVAANRPAAPTLKEQLETFTSFTALLPKGAQESTQAMFEKGMEFAMKIVDARGDGDGGGGSALVTLAREALHSPIVKDILNGMAVAAQNQNGQNPQRQIPQQLLSLNNPMAAQIMSTLMAQAKAGLDPAIVAVQVLDNCPPAIMQELEATDDVVAHVIAGFPEAAQYRPWFEALVANMFDPAQAQSGLSPALETGRAATDDTQQPKT